MLPISNTKTNSPHPRSQPFKPTTIITTDPPSSNASLLALEKSSSTSQKLLLSCDTYSNPMDDRNNYSKALELGNNSLGRSRSSNSNYGSESNISNGRNLRKTLSNGDLEVGIGTDLNWMISRRSKIRNSQRTTSISTSTNEKSCRESNNNQMGGMTHEEKKRRSTNPNSEDGGISDVDNVRILCPNNSNSCHEEVKCGGQGKEKGNLRDSLLKLFRKNRPNTNSFPPSPPQGPPDKHEDIENEEIHLGRTNIRIIDRALPEPPNSSPTPLKTFPKPTTPIPDLVQVDEITEFDLNSPGSDSSPSPTQPHDFSASIDRVKDCGWYWGPLSSDEAESLLKNEPDGTFIVRDSSDVRYIFSLTFKLNSVVRHVRIEHDQGNFSFGPLTRFKSSTIVDFVEKAVAHSRSGRYLFFLHRRPQLGPMRVQLLHPFSRFRLPQSLQFMCRFVILKHVRKDFLEALPLPPPLIDYLNTAHYYYEEQSESLKPHI